MIYIKPFLGAFFLLSFSSSPIHSEELVINPLGRDELVRRILKEHPSRAKWQLEVRVQKEQGTDAGLWERPSLRLTNQGQSMLGGDGKGVLAIALEQKVPLGKQNDLSRDLSEISVKIKVEEIRLRKLKLARTAEDIWIEKVFLKEKKKQLDRILELNRQLRDFLSKGSGLGEVSALDVSEADLELANLQSELLHLEEREDVVSQKLNELLGLKAGEAIQLDVTDFFSPEILEGLEAELQRHPQLILSTLELQRNQLDFSSLKASRFDHLNLEVEWEEEKEVDSLGTTREGSLAVSVSMPLPFRTEKPGALQAAGSATEVARESVKVLQYQLQKKGQRLINRYQNLKNHLELMDDKVLVRNDLNLELHKKAHQEGRIDQSRLLRAHERALKHRLNRLQILRELAEVSAQWRELTSAHINPRTEVTP